MVVELPRQSYAAEDPPVIGVDLLEKSRHTSVLQHSGKFARAEASIKQIDTEDLFLAANEQMGRHGTALPQPGL